MNDLITLIFGDNEQYSINGKYNINSIKTDWGYAIGGDLEGGVNTEICMLYVDFPETFNKVSDCIILLPLPTTLAELEKIKNYFFYILENKVEYMKYSNKFVEEKYIRKY